MHPYRASWSPPVEPPGEHDAGCRLAFRVLTAVAAVQLVAALPGGGVPYPQTLFAAVCAVTGGRWLVRHRSASAAGSRMR